MIKGKLQIELKDEKTGRIERHEEENMVTNAVANLLGLGANAAPGYNLLQELLPISQKALGGIFLFDGTLSEDADNVHFPMDVHLTGSAGKIANGSSKIIGSFNAAESGRTDTGYTNVWDFSTSQANGTIASLALTNYKCGENPFYNTTCLQGNISLSTSYHVVGNDPDKGIVYLYQSGKIFEKRLYTNLIRVNSPEFGEEKVVFDFGFTNPSYSYWVVMNGYDGYVYAINCEGHSNEKDTPIRIRRVKISDYSFDEEPELVFTVEKVTCQSARALNYYLDSYFAVSKGYLYFTSYDYKTVYKIDLSNTADVKALTFEDKRVAYIFPRYNGGLHARFDWDGLTASGSKTVYYSPGYIYPDGKYRYLEDSTSGYNYGSYYASFEGEKLNQFPIYSSTLYYAYTRNYLGTICNLSSPVVKTSAQSMKITYTLTDV